MTDEPETDSDREARLAEFDREVGKALKSCREGRVYDADTVFAAAHKEFEKAKAKRAA